MNARQLPLQEVNPRFAQAMATSKLIAKVDHPAAKNMLIRQLLAELKAAIGGPVRVGK